jgi:hypothetical protein
MNEDIKFTMPVPVSGDAPSIRNDFTKLLDSHRGPRHGTIYYAEYKRT